jgi:hypothetical protein
MRFLLVPHRRGWVRCEVERSPDIRRQSDKGGPPTSIGRSDDLLGALCVGRRSGDLVGALYAAQSPVDR